MGSERDPRTALWRRLDIPGHEAARLAFGDGGWTVEGAAVFADGSLPCRLDYRIRCDGAWRTRSVRVEGWLGAATVGLDIAVDPDRRWLVNGAECRAVAGCIDVDLSWSPSTNTLPIRRLGLGIGESADVRAAWVRLPGLTLEPLEQVYRRGAETAYRYESAGGAFTADLLVDAAGLVTHYPGLWARQAAA